MKSENVIKINNKRKYNQEFEQRFCKVKKRNKVVKVRDIPKFDDYDQWKQQSLYFVKSQQIELNEQVDIIMMGLSGLARKLVAKRHDIQLLFQLFETLEELFKRPGDDVQIALSTRQMPDESERDFALRFQAIW